MKLSILRMSDSLKGDDLGRLREASQSMCCADRAAVGRQCHKAVLLTAHQLTIAYPRSMHVWRAKHCFFHKWALPSQKDSSSTLAGRHRQALQDQRGRVTKA